MKYGFLFCLLFFSSWSWSQPRETWQMKAVLSQIIILEKDSALQQKDSLYTVYLTLIEKLKQMQVEADSFYQVSLKMYAEARLIQGIIERNEVTSIAQKDSLTDVYQHLYSRAGAIRYYIRFFPDKRDTFNTVMAGLAEHQPGLDRAIVALIEMVSDTNSYSLITVDGLLKLGESHHPAAISFLMDNLMNFEGTNDPTNFGRDPSFYVWPENHPCYEYLVEYINTGYNMGWHLLPDFNRALNQQLIPEKYINLYATLLNYITQTCKPCRDVWLEDYLKQTEGQNHVKNGRANVLQIMEFYKNPRK